MDVNNFAVGRNLANEVFSYYVNKAEKNFNYYANKAENDFNYYANKAENSFNSFVGDINPHINDILHYAWHKEKIHKISKRLGFKENMCQYQLPIILTLYRLNDNYNKNIVDCSGFLNDCDAALGKCSCNSITYGDFLSSDENLRKNLRERLMNSNIIYNPDSNKDYPISDELKKADKIAISHAWMSTSKNNECIKNCVKWFKFRKIEIWLDLVNLEGKWTDQYTADIFGDQVIIVEPCLAEREIGHELNWQALLLCPWGLRGWTLVELLVAKNVWIWTQSDPVKFYDNSVIKLEEWVGDEGMNNLLKNELVNIGIIGLPLNLLKNHGLFESIDPVKKENKNQYKGTEEEDIAWIVTALSGRIWTFNADLVKALYQFIHIKKKDEDDDDKNKNNETRFINLIKHAGEHCGLWLTTRLGRQSTYDGWIPYCLPFSGIKWYNDVSYLVKNPKLTKEGLTFKGWIYDIDNKIKIRTPIKSMDIYIKQDKDINGVMNVLHRGNIRYDVPKNSDSWFSWTGGNPVINNNDKNFVILLCKHEIYNKKDKKDNPCNKKQCLTRCVIYFHEGRISFTGILHFNKPCWKEMDTFTVS